MVAHITIIWNYASMVTSQWVTIKPEQFLKLAQCTEIIHETLAIDQLKLFTIDQLRYSQLPLYRSRI